MEKQSFSSNEQSGKAAKTGKKKWLILGIILGKAIVVVAAAMLAAIACAKPSPITKLEIKDMVIGTGREAKTGDTVMVEYIGWVYDKYIKDRNDFFDRSANHEKPFEFVLGNMSAIEGFDQGIPGMKVGGQRQLTIPPNLAYGDRAALNGKIPPHSALVFEVELLEVATTLPPTSVIRLKVEDQVVGTGAQAKAGNTLRVHYTGWLEDGTKFDSSRDSGEPIEFVLGKGQVIQGWERGLVGMKVGGKRKLTIPPDLGYGDRGAVDYIPRNAALIFEVELLSIK